MTTALANGGANPARGETALTLAGQSYTIRPTFQALVAAEADVGPLFALVEKAAAGQLTLADTVSLINALLGGGGGLVSTATGLLGGLLGAPGRATGGPVSPGRPYLVGEQGPELFVPMAAGNIAAAGSSGAARAVQVAISIAAPTGAEPQALARSSRQVARAVTRALAQAER